jgi:hypothetical protein
MTTYRMHKGRKRKRSSRSLFLPFSKTVIETSTARLLVDTWRVISHDRDAI